MIACIGGAHRDHRGVVRGTAVLGTSNPGAVFHDFGGVARNVAENLAHLGCPVTLVSRVGDDEAGRQVRERAAGGGIDVSWFTVSHVHPTASYTAILENEGELVIGLADMAVYDELTLEILRPALPRLRQSALWFLDTNLPAATIGWLLEAADGIPIAADAISVVKSQRLSGFLPRISWLFANTAQAMAMADTRHRLTPCEAAERLHQLGGRAGVVTAGAAGIAVWNGAEIAAIPALPARTRDVSGAGDALVAATLYGIWRGERLMRAAQLGLAAAAITVESEYAAVPDLTPALLESRLAFS
jgi:pseudouridine kinase